QHLADDQVEEGFAVAHNQKRLRLLQAHAGAKTPVELQHDSLGKKSSVSWRRGNLLVIGQLLDRVDGTFRNQPAFLGSEKLESAFKRSNRRFAQPRAWH